MTFNILNRKESRSSGWFNFWLDVVPQLTWNKWTKEPRNRQLSSKGLDVVWYNLWCIQNRMSCIDVHCVIDQPRLEQDTKYRTQKFDDRIQRIKKITKHKTRNLKDESLRLGSDKRRCDSRAWFSESKLSIFQSDHWSVWPQSPTVLRQTAHFFISDIWAQLSRAWLPNSPKTQRPRATLLFGW